MMKGTVVSAGFAVAVAGILFSPAVAVAEAPTVWLACAVAQEGDRPIDVIHLIETEASGLGEAVQYCMNVLGGHPIRVIQGK